MDKCAVEYASALINPFGTRAIEPCIPDVQVKESFKLQTKARGVFSTGELGVGWISFSPFLSIISDGGNSASDTSFPVIYTNANYALQTYNWSVSGGAFTTGVAGASASSIFTSSSINTASRRRYRLVAAGLRINYIGSSFRNQGRVILYREPDMSNIQVLAQTPSYFLQDQYTSMTPVSTKTEYVFYTPIDNDDFNYHDFNFYDPNITGDDSTARRCLLIMIDGGDTDVPQSWQFETVAYYEVIGPNLKLSASHSDVESVGKILSSMPIKAPTVPPAVAEKTLFNKIANAFAEQASGAAVAATSYLTNRAANTVLNYMMGPQSMASSVPTITEI